MSVLVAVTFVRWNGRSLVEVAPTAMHFGTRVIVNQDRYRAKLTRPRPAGTLSLPGVAAASRFYMTDTGTAMIHDPHRQTLTAVVQVGHPAFVLLGADEQARRVSAWGRVLASIGTSGSVCQVQVLETSLPDSGRGIVDWWESKRSATAPNWATAEYEALLATASTATSAHRSLIAITMQIKRNRQVLNGAGQVAVAAGFLQQEMRTLETNLAAASLKLESWLGEAELAGVVRTAGLMNRSVTVGYAA